MFTAAPAPATAPAVAGVSGHVLGTLGASGAALAATVLLVVGVRAKHKIKFDAMQAAACAFVAGTLYASAAAIWTTPGDITMALAQAVQGSAGGDVGMGAIAVIICVIIYGAKLKPRTSALLGIAAASVFAAAGGIWGILPTVLASTMNHVGV